MYFGVIVVSVDVGRRKDVVVVVVVNNDADDCLLSRTEIGLVL